MSKSGGHGNETVLPELTFADPEDSVVEVSGPLPGLTPGYSDLCLQAAAEEIRYEDLILEILYLAAGRWGLLEPRELPPEKVTSASVNPDLLELQVE